ncbi:hypothetical protein BC829DRAFT_384011 [Chytridium lagenaria]|nr:hypothetical protein BC829DRAFT_384011 [Chytridium lagenaria]
MRAFCGERGDPLRLMRECGERMEGWRMVVWKAWVILKNKLFAGCLLLFFSVVRRCEGYIYGCFCVFIPRLHSFLFFLRKY